jgi:hypothetical protein
MSRKQWGHGYWSGIEAARWSNFRCDCFMSVWQWDLRHCWWRAISRPVKIDMSSMPYQGSVTILGFVWFFTAVEV